MKEQLLQQIKDIIDDIENGNGYDDININDLLENVKMLKDVMEV